MISDYNQVLSLNLAVFPSAFLNKNKKLLEIAHEMNEKNIGVLAFQGGVIEHLSILEKLGKQGVRVLNKNDLNLCSHLIIPGGESTVIGRFLKETKLDQEIIKLTKNKKLKIWGTCAGAILLGNKSLYSLKLIDVNLERNAYGSQIDSFEKNIEVSVLKKEIPAVFIRAPKIKNIGKDIEVLAKNKTDIVCCKNTQVMISTFHPELTKDISLHEYFVNNF